MQMEAPMSTTTEMRSEQATSKALAVDTKLEVIIIPVSDVDRSKRFYQRLGWRLDADIDDGKGFRAAQVTPPGSECSVIFGTGLSTSAPGSGQGLVLVVDDLEAARADLARHGAEVSEPFHNAFNPSGATGRARGRDPQGKPYSTFASFRDPDGNEWLLQEVPIRLPGRVTSYRGLINDAATLTELLREAEQRHGTYEATAPRHHWSHWYAAYMVAREHGRSPDEAAEDAARHMKLVPAG
jgi:catechol 2,3-dioxygenase-like lactoylglutathione lyase family enzyme